MAHGAVVSFDPATDEYALDAIDRLHRAAPAVIPLAAAGHAHGALAVLADNLGHGLATEILRDLQRQLDHWRDEGLISR
jgi:hypothetical protein